MSGSSGVLSMLWRVVVGAFLLLLAVYIGIAVTVYLRALDALGHPPGDKADAALVLGNRAWRDGAPNPCMTGRVDAAVELAREGLVPLILMSGGRDDEDGRIEAEEMARHALSVGYKGKLMLEPDAATTRENLSKSQPLLELAGARRVIVVTEPYHLWRAQKLAEASGFDGRFQVQYAAANSSCWKRSGMFFRGALREPLAIVNNAARGYLWH